MYLYPACNCWPTYCITSLVPDSLRLPWTNLFLVSTQLSVPDLGAKGGISIVCIVHLKGAWTGLDCIPGHGGPFFRRYRIDQPGVVRRIACHLEPVITDSTYRATMSIPSAVPRTAPIAIAPKPSRLGGLSRQNSINVDSYRPGSLRHGSGFDSPDSESPPSSGLPCETCRRRRIKCVMSEDDDACISCQIGGAECSLVTEGQFQRKRKLNGGDYHGEESYSSSKRR